MTLTRIVSISTVMVLLLTMTACGRGGKAYAPRQGSFPPTDIQLDSAMKEELLALANNRDAWFLASDITTESLEGLYGSWSVICRNETSLADYKGKALGPGDAEDGIKGRPKSQAILQSRKLEFSMGLRRTNMEAWRQDSLRP